MFKVGQRVHNNKAHYFCTISNMNNIVAWVTLDNILLTAVAIADLHETADDMLTTMGYRKIQENDALMVYEHEKMNDSYLMSSSILHFYHQHNAYYSSSAITPQLHLAIHQKLIELGRVE
jgi:hypothetical protein